MTVIIRVMNQQQVMEDRRSDYIHKVYDADSIAKIHVHGDGGGWIRNGPAVISTSSRTPDTPFYRRRFCRRSDLIFIKKLHIKLTPPLAGRLLTIEFVLLQILHGTILRSRLYNSLPICYDRRELPDHPEQSKGSCP